MSLLFYNGGVFPNAKIVPFDVVSGGCDMVGDG